jgi:hypothetical protein
MSLFDFGFHKLATIPPNRPSNSSLMITKVLGLTPLHQTTLLKSQQHKRSSTLTGLGCGATSWVLLGLKWTWIMGFIIFFPIPMCLGCVQWSIELLPIGLSHVQYKNP